MRIKTLGVIPARGGSKGVPRKNILDVGGKPLMGYVIEAALVARTLDAVVVSTEDDEIAQVAGRYPIRVVRRPAEFATDTAPIDGALRHAVAEVEAGQQRVETVVWLQANVPTTKPQVIDATVQMLLDTPEATAAQTVVPYRVPPQWAWRMDGKRLRPLEPCYSYTVRRQDLATAYHPDGAVNAMRRDILMAAVDPSRPAYLGDHRLAVVQDPIDSVEIDEPSDLEYFTFLCTRR